MYVLRYIFNKLPLLLTDAWIEFVREYYIGKI
jgi:hypothetical protein